MFSNADGRPCVQCHLHNLSPGAIAAGLAYPDEHLPTVNLAQLRELLYALSMVAADLTIYEPSSPEIRIKTDRDVFVVRTRYRRLCLVGWEPILRGEDHSVSYIISTITGTADLVKTAPKVERTFAASTHSTPPMRPGQIPRWTKICVLGILTACFLGITAWTLLRPPPSPVPPHELLTEAESSALLVKVAGEYETGGQEGDRRLIIDPDGVMHLAKFGPNRTVTQEKIKSARGALLNGRTVLITSDPAVLLIKDADTIVLFGTSYRRHLR